MADSSAASSAGSMSDTLSLLASRVPVAGLMPLVVYPLLTSLPVSTLLRPLRVLGIAGELVPVEQSGAVRQQVLSLLHSAWITGRALQVVADERWSQPGVNLLDTPHPLLPGICAQEVAYLLFDTLLMARARSYGAVLRGNLLVHHALFGITLSAYLLHSSVPKAQFFTAVLFLFNASTPLVSLRMLLKKYGAVGSRSSWLLDVPLLLTFFACRIAVMPWLLAVFERSKRTAAHAGSPSTDHSGLSLLLSDAWAGFARLPWYCRTGTIAATALNVMWFFGLVLKVVGERAGGKRLRAVLAKVD